MDYSAIVHSLVDNQASIRFILPALVIAGTFIINLLVTSLIKIPYLSHAIRYLSIGGLGIAIFLNSQLHHLPEVQAKLSLFNQLLQLDPWAVCFYQLLMGIALVLLLIPTSYSQSQTIAHNLYESMLLGSLLGAYGLVMANHWLVAYLSLTLMTASSAVLIYSSSPDQKSIASSFTYLIYQALASSIMLWGMAYLFSTGHLATNPDMSVSMLDSPGWLVGICLSLSAIFLQLGLFPFHFWIADVYDQAPMPVVAYLATIPKLAALAFLNKVYQVYVSPDNPYHTTIQSLLALLALITLVIGHLGAFRQIQPRRLLAYGSIAQGGLLLACVIAEKGVILTYYSLVYGLASLAAWLSLQVLESTHAHKNLPDYAGLSRQLPIASIGLCVALLAFIGFPPTAGFTGKWLFFTALGAIAQTTANLLIVILWLVGVLGTILSLYYYLKIPYALFFKPGQKFEASLGIPQSIQVILVFLVVLLVALFFFSHQLLGLLPTGQALP
jgi:NADH-quinone oxidoreductase subunit N